MSSTTAAPRIAVLDDYQGVALESADWTGLEPNVQVFRDHLDEEAQLVQRLRDFEIVVCMRERTPFPGSLLAQLPQLMLLVTTGMRNASIDLEAAARLGIVVTGTRGLGIQAAEMAWALLLAAARKIPTEDRRIREGAWQTTMGSDLAYRTLGIIGLGKLGAYVARIGRAFNMEVLAWSQNLTPERAAEEGVTAVSKETLLAQSDFITLHVVLSERTRHLIGRPELALMKPTSYLINTSRGGVIDEAALVEALQARRIAGAGLDVFEQEPLAPDHPLLALDNTVLTPHLGFVSHNAYALYYGDCVEDIHAYLAGQPIRLLSAQEQ